MNYGESAEGQKSVDRIVEDWQYNGRHMTLIAREMAKRDEKYFTGSTIMRSENAPWLDEVVRKNGRIFMGS